jgi:hypothetical protein
MFALIVCLALATLTACLRFAAVASWILCVGSTERSGLDGEDEELAELAVSRCRASQGTP